jgi:Fe-S cluster assembly ATP-binding protein
MLRIRDLHASIDGKEILRGLDLDVNAGEVHAIMGPNGSGKSTFAQILAGRDIYRVTATEMSFAGEDVIGMPAEIRARNGLFLAFQYPVEIPGVSNLYFLRSALNAVRAHRGLPEFDAVDFMAQARRCAAELGLDDAMLKRSVNEGFSGGEKKRNEVLQMMLLEPRLAILDETDSGLDIDALKVVAAGINVMRSPQRAIVLVTHYQRLLNFVGPDRVHVLMNGSIVRSGGRDLALELEQRGYSWLEQPAGV